MSEVSAPQVRRARTVEEFAELARHPSADQNVLYAFVWAVDTLGSSPDPQAVVGGAPYAHAAQATALLLTHQDHLPGDLVDALAAVIAKARDVEHVPAAVTALLAHPACTDRSVALAAGFPMGRGECMSGGRTAAARAVGRALLAAGHPVAAAVGLAGADWAGRWGVTPQMGVDLAEELRVAAGRAGADLGELVRVIGRLAPRWQGTDAELREAALGVLAPAGALAPTALPEAVPA